LLFFPGTLQYKLETIDDEGEQVIITIDDSFTGYIMGTPNITSDGM
jgi:hypothetical protein